MELPFRMCAKCRHRLGTLIIYRRSISTDIQQSRLQQRSYYDVLGVPRNATPTEIKQSYISLSKMLHPDANPTNPDQHNSFVELNHAYAVLSKAFTRHEYDKLMRHAGQGARPVRAWRASSDNPYGEAGTSQKTKEEWYQEMGYPPPFGTSSATADPDNYYGIKGVPRVSSRIIVYGCLLFILVGASAHFAIFKQGSTYVTRRLDEKDKRIATIYDEVKARAQQNGNKKQIELLRVRQMESNQKLETATCEDDG